MKTSTPYLPILAATFGSLLSLATAGPAKLIGVETKMALPPEAEDIVFGQHPKAGTQVKASFLVWPEAGESIIDINEKKCRVTEVVDAGNGQPVKFKPAFGNFPGVAKDGSVAVHSLEFPTPSEPGSGKVKMSGILSVVTAAGSKTEKLAEFALADAAKINAGDLKLEVTDLKTSEGKTKFGLKSGKPMRGIKDIRFFRPDGTVIPSDRNGTSSMTMLGTYSETWHLELEGDVKDVKLEVDLHQNMADKEMAFDFTIPCAL